MPTASPRILALATAVPPHVYGQDHIREFAGRLFATRSAADPRLLAVFENAQVGARNVCVPIEWFEQEHSFGEKNDLYLEHAFELSRRVVSQALERAGLAPAQVDNVIFVSSTGLATPTIDAQLANHFGFRRDIRRTPIWGLGCSAAAAGIALAADFARAAPASITLVIAVELCSLAFQPEDDLRLSLVSASLFSDGAAAALVAGPEAAARAALPGDIRLEIVGAQSTLWPDSLDVMGWKIDGSGFHLVLSRDLPASVALWLRPALTEFVAHHGLRLEEIDPLVMHPGGTRVLDAVAEALDVPEAALETARAVLREHGNMSSPTVIFVLERMLAEGRFRPGKHGLLAAMGAGFSADSVLLRATTG